MLARQSALHSLPEVLAAVHGQHGLLFDIFDLQQAARARIAEQQVRPGVDDEQAFVHVLRDGGELRLAAAQLVHLRGDLPVLGGNFLQQGGKLVIGLRLLRMLQVESIQRADDALRQTIGQQPRQRNGDKHGRNGRAQHPHQNSEDGITRSGQTEHRAVLQAAGIVERLLGQRRGIALALTRAVAQGISHLGARGMVLHLRGGSLVVIADGAVGADPGDARREMSPASRISLEMGQPSPPHERASAQSCPPRFLWQNPNILSPSFNFIVTSGVAAPLGKHIPGPDGPRGNRRSRRCIPDVS